MCHKLIIFICHIHNLIETPIHIFVVDDDPDDQAFIQEALAKEDPNCYFHTFNDGAEFADYLRVHPDVPAPAIFIVDHNMPRLTGMELLTSFYECGSFSQVVKMLWSTSFTEEILIASQTLGVRAFFEKPNSSEGFTKLARRILETALKSPTFRLY